MRSNPCPAEPGNPGRQTLGIETRSGEGLPEDFQQVRAAAQPFPARQSLLCSDSGPAFVFPKAHCNFCNQKFRKSTGHLQVSSWGMHTEQEVFASSKIKPSVPEPHPQLPELTGGFCCLCRNFVMPQLRTEMREGWDSLAQVCLVWSLPKPPFP